MSEYNDRIAAIGEPPLSNSYWVRPGSFAAGDYPGAKRPDEAATKLKALLSAGIDFFIDLTTPSDGLKPYAEIAREEARRLGVPLGCEWHPIPDLSIPENPTQMASILNSIDAVLESGRTVYLHCWGGTGRTGTVIGCWLVRHGHTGEEALEQIRELRKNVEKLYRAPHSPHTTEQREYVRSWTETPQDT